MVKSSDRVHENFHGGKDVQSIPEKIIEMIKNGLEEKYSKQIPRFYLSQFRAIRNWLERFISIPDSTAVEKVQGYLESLHHICILKLTEAAKLNLCIPININRLTDELTVPLQDYLLYKGLIAELFSVIKEINSINQGSEVEDYDILLLQGKAWSWSGSLGKASYFFEKVASQSPQDSPPNIEAIARLGIDQIRAGKYSTGLANLQFSLENLEKNEKIFSCIYLLDIRADINESLAFFNVMKCNFIEALELYSNVIEVREKIGYIHKLSYPKGSQGVVIRKLYTHPASFFRIVLSQVFSCKFNFSDFLSGKLMNSILIEGYEKSIAYLEQAKSFALKNGGETAWLDHHIGISLLCKGDRLLAEDYNVAALTESRSKNYEKGTADCLDLMGFIFLSKHEFESAYNSFKEALSIREATQSIHGVVNSKLNLSISEWHRGNYFKSIQELFLSFYRYHKLGILVPSRVLRILILFRVWALGGFNWLM